MTEIMLKQHNSLKTIQNTNYMLLYDVAAHINKFEHWKT